jgi:hypothetical protein
MMPKQIEDLPFEYQKLFAELKAEKDAVEASASDYVIEPTNEDVIDEYEQLDSVIEEEDGDDDDYDESDENTYDMKRVSNEMRSMFD